MMKKLAKAALLAAATAFLLAGFPACSSDDDDDVYITNPDDSDADKDSEGDKTEDEGGQADKDDESEGDKSDEEGDGEEEDSGEEDGDGEGEDDKEDDSDDDNKEDDSDDNEGENQGGGDNGVTTITINSDDYKDEFIELGFGSTAAPIAEDVPIELESGVTLTLLASNSAILGDKAKNAPNFKLHDTAGFIIKNCAVKLSGIKGNVRVTVDWRLNGAKGENDRYMLMKVGNNNVMEKGNVDSNVGSFNTEQPSLVDTFDFGTEGGDIYIGASNELALRSIKIESAQ